MQPTPEQIQQALLEASANDIYSASRDDILRDVATAYAAMIRALSKNSVLESRIATGDLQRVAPRHAAMTAAMAGQNEAIQAAFTDCTAVLEAAQAIVYGVTGRAFIKGVPIPAEPEPEP